MKPIFKNFIAVIAGLITGSIVNMGILEIGHLVIVPPEGFDNSTMDSLAATIHFLGPINYISVFLAHGFGTLAGVFIACKIAANRHPIFASVIGGWFLLGGIWMVFIIPSPTWFTIIDLIGAYIPMAWIGYHLASNKK